MKTEEQDALDALASEFIAEIRDDLAALEPDLLIMEEKGDTVDDDLVNRAFRSIHSIKGGAGFINFKDLSGLSHAMENVLMRVREKSLVITSEVVDALLAGLDKMKVMVESGDRSHDYEAEQAALLKITAPEISDRQDPGLERVNPLGDNPLFCGKIFLLDRKRLESALNHQKFIYAALVLSANDTALGKKDSAAIVEDLKSIGELLFSDFDPLEGEKSGRDFFCVIATILDLPLLAQVLEIDKDRIVLVDRQFIDPGRILNGVSPKPLPDSVPEPVPELISEPLSDPVSDITEELPVPGKTMGTASHEETGNTSPPPPSRQTIRINVDLISRLMNRAGELVLARNQLRSIMEKYVGADRNSAVMMQNLDMVTTDIQEAVMQMRMQPVVDLMGKYKRVVRDIARRMSKKVDFVLQGADVEVDRSVLEKLANPVTHLIRNCIDHGIETPEERTKRSKPETGTIHIKAFHQGGQVHIIIRDDGAGLDPQLILSKAFEKGLVTEDQLDRLTDREKIQLIFLPGFSTSEEVTDISGRGVGMDVVKTNIERLRGRIRIDSTMGEGTSFHLIVPLTLAIVPSLIVGSGDTRFALPQVNIKEVLFLEPGQIHGQVENLAGSEVLRLRDCLVPVLRLRNVLGIKTYVQNSNDQTQIQNSGPGETLEEKRKAIADRRGKSGQGEDLGKRRSGPDRRLNAWDPVYVVILKLGENLFGLCVDELYDIEEVVIEPLPETIKHLKNFAGVSILGDGDVIMVLDVPGIAVGAKLKFDPIRNEEFKRKQQQQKAAGKRGEMRSLLVFGTRNQEYFAMELKHIERIEPLQPLDIHYAGRLKYAEYQDRAVPLFSMDEFLPAPAWEPDDREMFAVFPKHISTRAGIVVSVIIDTIETDRLLQRNGSSPEPVLGKLFVNDMMVQVLDPEKIRDLMDQNIQLKFAPATGSDSMQDPK